MNVTQGVVITNVVPGSPAAQAGLQVRDIITAVNGTPLDNESALARIQYQHQPGDTLTLAVLRGSRQMTVQLVLGTAPLT